MAQKQEQHHVFQEMWDIVLRYRWRLIVPAFAITTLVLSVSLVLPRKYRAQAIFERRTDIVLTEMSNRGATRTFQNPRDSLAEELTGQPAIEELLRSVEPELGQFGLKTPLRRQMLRDDLQRHVLVHRDISSNDLDRIRVEYVGADPKLAQTLVNGLVRNYMSRARRDMDAQLSQSAAFFQAEVTRNRQVIEQLENQALDFEIKNGELLPENPNNVQMRLAETRQTLTQLISERDAAASRVESIAKGVQETQETVPTLVKGPNPELARLDGKLRQMTEELAVSTEVYKMKPEHPAVVDLKQQIERLKQEMAGTEIEVVTQRQFNPNPKRTELELQLSQAKSQHQALCNQVASLQQQTENMASEVERMFPIRSEYRKLTRDVSQAQRQVAFWEDNLRRVELAMAAESGDRGVKLDFVQPAAISSRPVSPDLGQVLTAAIGLGLLAGALSVFFAHRTNETFTDLEQLTSQFSLPTFGSVSELITKQQRRLRKLRRAILYPANAVVMGAVVIAMVAALYMDLEKPALWSAIKQDAASAALAGHATEPSAPKTSATE
jgi:uncharacterized protein involved in exopolysaccharide biosynthesis